MSVSAALSRHLCWLPPVLLVAVASHQIWLTRTESLSPWSGGGFGMFSTTDVGVNRHMHIYLDQPGLRRERLTPKALYEEELRALTLPSERRLRLFASDVVEYSGADPDSLESIEVQVWAVDYDPATLRPSGRLVGTVRVDPRD